MTFLQRKYILLTSALRYKLSHFLWLAKVWTKVLEGDKETQTESEKCQTR